MENEILINLKNYELLHKIGNGASSEVYKIKDNRTGEMYAAKISYKPLSSNSKEENINLNRELNIMAKINHPCIVNFIGFSPKNYHQEDRPVIITELVSNGTLADVIDSVRKSLAPDLWDDTRK